MNAFALAQPFSLVDEMLRRARRWLIALAGITTAALDSFRREILTAKHDFTLGQDAFKLALFRAGGALVGTYSSASTNYSDMTGNGDEVANGNGYVTGGFALTNTTPVTVNNKACTTPSASAVWAAATFVTRGCMAYNSSKLNRGWFVYDFGGDISVVAGTLTIGMPVNDDTHALTRV